MFYYYIFLNKIQEVNEGITCTFISNNNKKYLYSIIFIGAMNSPICRATDRYLLLLVVLFLSYEYIETTRCRFFLFSFSLNLTLVYAYVCTYLYNMLYSYESILFSFLFTLSNIMVPRLQRLIIIIKDARIRRWRYTHHPYLRIYINIQRITSHRHLTNV